jgi:hypothetical protein
MDGWMDGRMGNALMLMMLLSEKTESICTTYLPLHQVRKEGTLISEWNLIRRALMLTKKLIIYCPIPR